MRFARNCRAVARETWILLIFMVLIAGILSYPYWSAYVVGVPPAKYSTGLTAKFKVFDKSGKALLTDTSTGTPVTEIYALGTDPFPYLFTGKPDTVAVYDTTYGYWSASLDENGYTVLIYDSASGSEVRYPAVSDFTVPATDDPDKETWCVPSTFNAWQRATISVTNSSILAYHEAGQIYNITAATINCSAYNKWRVEYRIIVDGRDKLCMAGKLYWSEITNLMVTKVLVDGVEVGVSVDRDASTDRLTGYCAAFGDWEGGEIHHVIAFFDDGGASVSAGTETLQIADGYAIQNIDLKWWTYSSVGVTVNAG